MTFDDWFATLAEKDPRVVPYEMFMLEAWIAGQRHADNAKFRTALQHIADGCTGLGNQAQWAGNVARKALRE